METERTRAFSASSLLAGILAGVAMYWRTSSFWKAALISTAYPLVAGFARRIWQELQPRWATVAADWIDERIKHLFTAYLQRYRQHLIYKHRTFDVKGFSTQGPYALELETVFVDLSIDPTAAAAISQDPIDTAGYSFRCSIFDWLGMSAGLSQNDGLSQRVDLGQKVNLGHNKSRTDKAPLSATGPRHLAIVGPPGSGKTTLFKHLALVLCSKHALFKSIPVLLFIREFAVAIAEKQTITLTEIIEASLTDIGPPTGWFRRALRAGKCLIMFDGLDEVANPVLRQIVVKWIERQAAIFGANQFLLSSRPNGYRSNPLSDFTVLRVLPFDGEQVRRFVENWYLANEMMAHQRDDPGVRMEARRSAEDLLQRIRRNPTLQELSANPLLITLIATVHRYRSELPGRRVELYREICEVFLGKRQQARGLELELTPAQKICVLRTLAYQMMRKKKRELYVDEASKVITPILLEVDPRADSAKFLSMIEDSSGLLLQREADYYGFAHLTFQEYLASVHIKEERLGSELISDISDPWWNETIRLFAAQADASPIVEACLRLDNPDIENYILAVDCSNESLQLRTDLRDRLRHLTEVSVEDVNSGRGSLAAEVVLAHRFKNSMVRIQDDIYIDRRLITNAEYQIFIDASKAQGTHRQPDHWNSFRFSPGVGLLPVTGVRSDDAKAFCDWLSRRTPGAWQFRLPTELEARDWERIRESGRDLQFWQTSSNRILLSGNERSPWRLQQAPRKVTEILSSDAKLIANLGHSELRGIRAVLRILLADACERVGGPACQLIEYSDRSLIAKVVEEYDLAEALSPDLDRAANLDPARQPGRPLALSRCAERASERALQLEVDPHKFPLFVPEEWKIKPIINSLWTLLNAYCAVEEEAENRVPIPGALWIVRSSPATPQIVGKSMPIASSLGE